MRIMVFIVFTSVMQLQVHSQTFMTLFGDPLDRTIANGMYQHYDSSVYVSANALDPQNHNAILLTKFDQLGNELWSNKLPSTESEVCNDMAYLNGYLYFFGEKDTANMKTAFIKKTDLLGNEVWSKRMVNGTRSSGFRGGSSWGSNGVVAIGFINDTVNNNNNSYAVNLDEQGNVIWEHELAISNNNNGQELEVEGSNVYLVCDRQKPNFAYSMVIQSLDNSGAVNWTDTVITPYNSGSQNAFYNNGELFVVGESSTASSIQFDPILIKYNALSGQRLSLNYLNLTPNSEAAFDAIPLDDTRLITCGYGYNVLTGGSDMMLIVADTSGAVLQTRFYGNNEFDLATDAMGSFRGGSFFCGEIRQGGRKYGALLYFDEFGFNSIPEMVLNEVYVESISDGTIQFNTTFDGRYELYKLNGSLVAQGQVENDHIELQRKDLPRQIYVLKLLGASRRAISQKIILD